MSFLYPQLLWLLLAPATLLLLALRPARSAVAAYPKIPHARLGPSSFALGRPSFSPRPIAASLALALLIAALARPQGGEIATPAVVRARDVLVAVDVSRSMLADDVAPSRLERARLLVRALVDELHGERVGLLPFAGSAFLQSPLSTDYGILRTFLDELGPDMIPAGGSDFTALLTVADEAFGPVSEGPAAAPPADRYLIVLSDGEAQDESWRAVAAKLSHRGVRAITLGLGTTAGAMIPDGKGGFVKDERGAVVLSRLDAATLRELARVTDGAYRDASTWIDLPSLLRETVSRGRAAESVEENSVRRAELFTWFLAPALALLFLSLVRELPVSLRPRALKLARAAALTLVVHGSLIIGHRSDAATPAAESDPLVDLVARVSAQASVSASDLARLAQLSIERGESDPNLPQGSLRDALAAVAQGRKLAPKAADWNALQEKLEALLEPPPPPPQQENQPPPPESQPPEEKPEGEKQDQSSSSDQKSGSPQSGEPSESQQNDGEPSSESSNPDSAQNGAESQKSPSNPQSSSDALGDLQDGQPDSPRPSPADQKEPTQKAGGVSSSGQPRDGTDNASADPALAVPQQRLDRVRDADSPAQFFKLIQDSELPPDARERAAAGRTRDW